MEESAMEATPSVSTSRWQGGVSPWGMSWQKMMMWWFIVTDALLFAGFLGSYGFHRLGSSNWPDTAEVFHLVLITVMTFVLISSSATMAVAVAAARAGDRGKVKAFLGFTIVGGLIFMGMQAIEWSAFIADGGRLHTNPWGDAGFGAYFFMVTGFHGTHVLLGVVILLITLLRQRAGKGTANGVEVAGLYWHFVDLVWVFIFGCFYLI
jgi:cytochrome c oxidase subunit 3